MITDLILNTQQDALAYQYKRGVEKRLHKWKCPVRNADRCNAPSVQKRHIFQCRTNAGTSLSRVTAEES